MNEFMEFYNYEKVLINEKLKTFNETLVEEDNPLIKENLELLRNLNSDGKLIRGTLINLGYYLLKDNREYSNDLALAYELFQTAILVHDDIIDNDNKRRGKDTIHFASKCKYSKYSDNDVETSSLGSAIAICMGDYGLYLANKMIVDAYSSDKSLPRLLSYFNDIVLKTIKGELLDVILPFESRHNIIDSVKLEDNIMNIYRLKTAYYTIIGPISLGIILAGGDDQKIDDITKFGTSVGCAFQIQDDILGIYSNEMGKVEGSDIKEFKQTILYSYTINTKYKDELLKYYGCHELNDDSIRRVQDIFKKSGAYEYACSTMNKMYDDAIGILDSISWIDEEKRELLHGFIEYLRERRK